MEIMKTLSILNINSKRLVLLLVSLEVFPLVSSVRLGNQGSTKYVNICKYRIKLLCISFSS